MLVSIITPMYNSEATISETIQSVIAQTYTEWEMVIVDDCSTDESASIVEKYQNINQVLQVQEIMQLVCQQGIILLF